MWTMTLPSGASREAARTAPRFPRATALGSKRVRSSDTWRRKVTSRPPALRISSLMTADASSVSRRGGGGVGFGGGRGHGGLIRRPHGRHLHRPSLPPAPPRSSGSGIPSGAGPPPSPSDSECNPSARRVIARARAAPSSTASECAVVIGPGHNQGKLPSGPDLPEPDPDLRQGAPNELLVDLGQLPGH